MDLPGELRLHVGEARAVPLPNHRSGGFRWESAVDGGAVGAAVRDDPPPARGAGGGRGTAGFAGQVLHLWGVRAGTADVVVRERRSWEAGDAAVHRVRVHVEEERGRADEGEP